MGAPQCRACVEESGLSPSEWCVYRRSLLLRTLTLVPTYPFSLHPNRVCASCEAARKENPLPRSASAKAASETKIAHQAAIAALKREFEEKLAAQAAAVGLTAAEAEAKRLATDSLIRENEMIKGQIAELTAALERAREKN